MTDFPFEVASAIEGAQGAIGEFKSALVSDVPEGRLVGKKLGDEVEVPVPRGTLKLRIVGISID